MTTMSALPHISVVISTYNRASLLHAAIKSIQAQHFTDWEMLVVDDGSTDDTCAMVRDLAKHDARIIYLFQPHKGFPAAGLNRALAQARGEYLYKNDDDDVSEPDALTQTLAALQDKPTIVFCARMRATRPNRHGEQDIIWSSPLLFRCASLRQLGGWNEFYHAAEDDELRMRAHKAGLETVDVDKVLYHCGRIGRYSVSRGPHVLTYQLALHKEVLLRNWGLPVPSRQGLSVRRVLRRLTGQDGAAPMLLAARLQQDLALRFVMEPQLKRVWHGTLQPIHALAFGRRHMGKLWYAMTYMWQTVGQAHLPWRLRGHVLGYLLAHILPTQRRKSLRQAALVVPKDCAQAPMVSIIIPSCNRAGFLQEAIASLQAQDFTDWEMFVVDDGSHDNTPAVVRAAMAADARIKYLRQKHKGYPAAGLNYALRHARGKYLYKHDDDDIALPQKLSHCVAHMEAHPDHFSVRVCFSHRHNRAARYMGFPLFFRTEAVRLLGGWHRFFHALEDIDLLMRAAAAGWSFGFLDECLYIYRKHKQARISQSSRVFAYRLVIDAGKRLAQWGLPGLAVMHSSLRHCVLSLSKPTGLLPQQARNSLAQYFNHWHIAYRPTWYRFNELHLQLSRASPAFPYKALWQACWVAWRLLWQARLPWHRAWVILWGLPRYYFRPEAQTDIGSYKAYKQSFLQRRMQMALAHRMEP